MVGQCNEGGAKPFGEALASQKSADAVNAGDKARALALLPLTSVSVQTSFAEAMGQKDAVGSEGRDFSNFYSSRTV